MALYCLAKPITMSGNYSKRYLFAGNPPEASWYLANFGSTLLCSLVLTNDPTQYDPSNAKYYEEWYVGKNSFVLVSDLKAPTFPEYPDTIAIAKDHIVTIATFPGEFVKMPEDCTGLFSNMSLGFCDGTSYASKGHYISKKADGTVEEDYTWDNTTAPDRQYTANVNINFSQLDFSDTTNMTSLFENCLGSKSTLTGKWWHHYYPHQGFNRDEWSETYYFLKPRSIRFSGIDAWDTTKVTTIDRMFANINWGISSYKDTIDESFIVGGTNDLYFPNVTSAKNLFANSKMNINAIRIVLDNSNLDFSFAFSNFTGHNTKLLNISKWSIKATSGSLQSMFRNIGVETLQIGGVLNNLVESLTDESALNYMFTNDGSVNRGVLKKITVKLGTDWKKLNANLSGYKMFTNLIGLSNFVSANNDINYANNVKSTGYFDQAPPEITSGSYIKLRSGWEESEVYFKTENGWKESEVYM